MTAQAWDPDDLLDEPVGQRPPPMLVPWGWRIFFVLLAGFDIVCLLVGRVPWTGEHGLDRAAILLILINLGLVHHGRPDGEQTSWKP